MKPKDQLGHEGKYPNTIVRTATILATVYIDGNYVRKFLLLAFNYFIFNNFPQDSDLDPLCVFDCDRRPDESGIVESIDHIPPTDRRYWLLTVVAGLFSPQDFPILEEKLAKLYRIAFLRQQAKHLGIANGNNSTMNQTTTDQVERKKRSVDEKIVIMPTATFNGSEKIQTRRFEINRNVYERQVLRMKRQRNTVKHESPPTPPPTPPPKSLRLPYEILFRSEDRNKSRKLKTKSNQNFMQKVIVTIHNLSHGDDEVIDTNKIDVPFDKSNQTEIIYSVIVGGKPVLASTAADDMRLVKMGEVVKIMENDIVLKAERKIV